MPFESRGFSKIEDAVKALRAQFTDQLEGLNAKRALQTMRKQRGLVAQHIEKFRQLHDQTQDLTDADASRLFLESLNQKLRLELELKKPVALTGRKLIDSRIFTKSPESLVMFWTANQGRQCQNSTNLMNLWTFRTWSLPGKLPTVRLTPKMLILAAFTCLHIETEHGKHPQANNPRNPEKSFVEADVYFI
jgi:hypothetical protein